MANTIILKKSSTASAVPSAGSLQPGELAVNLADAKLYTKTVGGTVILVGSGASGGGSGTVTSVDVSGGTTGLTTSGGPITGSGTITLGGTLAVANGGTGTGTAFTAGSVVFAGASGVYSQNNASLFWDNSTGRLGVNTSSPSNPLDVVGNIRAYSAAGSPNITAQTNTAAQSPSFTLLNNGMGTDLKRWEIITDASTNDLTIRTVNDAYSQAANAMKITRGSLYTIGSVSFPNGSVGVGGTPTAKFDVFGTNGNIQINNAGDQIAYTYNGYNYITASGAAATLQIQATGASGAVTVATNGSERVRITSGGDVGIGISSPSTTGKFVVSGGYAATAYSSVGLLTPGAAQGEQSDIALYSTFIGTADNTPRRTADIIAGFSTATWGTEYLSFNVGNNGSANDTKVITSEKVRIHASGGVSIGNTTDPGAGNATANSFQDGYTTTATAAGTTTLTVASTGMQYFTGTTTQTLVLPVTSTLKLGWTYHVANTSTGVLTVQSSGANTICTIPPGLSVMFTCILTSGTTAASWDYGFTDFPAVTPVGGSSLNDSLFRLNANGSAIGPTIADYFNTNSAVTLPAAGVYELEFELYFTKTTAGTVTFTLTSDNAPVNLNAYWIGTAVGGVGTAAGATQAALVASTSAAAALPATGSLTTAVNHHYTIKVVLNSHATLAETIRLRVTSSAGTVTPLRGSMYRVRNLTTGNSGTFVA